MALTTPICSKCKVEKTLCKNGIKSAYRCITCRKIYNQKYNCTPDAIIKRKLNSSKPKNILKKQILNRKYKELRKEYRRWKRKNDFQYRAKERAYNNRKCAERLKKDLNFRLKFNLRSRLNKALKRNTKKGSAVRDLGCSIEDFKKYLESLFKTGMTWKNYGMGKDKWNIDHIIPLSKVDLTNKEEFLKVCHYSNLQPLWFEENRIKSNKEVF